LLEINVTLLIQFINFVLLMVVLNFLMYRPLRAILKKRRDEISDSHARARVLAKDAQSKLNLYETKLDKARKKGAEVKNQLRQDGLDEEKKMLAEAEGTAEEKKDSIRKQIVAEAGAAKEQLQAQADLLAKEIAEKLLGRAV